jgi:purine catabolism regulator
MNAKSISLKDLLRLSFPRPLTWLAGECYSDRQVRWVATCTDVLQEGDLLLVESSGLNAPLIQQAQLQGAVGIIVIGKNEISLPLEAAGLAVLIAAEPEGGIYALQRQMLVVLINQRAALMERGARIHAQLSQLEAEGKGLEGLVKAMSEIAGRGILIQDKRGWILAQHPSTALLSAWKNILEQLGDLAGLPDYLVDRRQSGSPGTVITQQMPGGLERLIAPVIVGEMARGYLSLVALQGEIDDLDYLVIEQGCFVCAIEMARNKAIRETEKRLKGDLLTALLQDDLSPRDAGLWVQTMGLDLEQAHVALRFAWDGPDPPSRRRLETLVNGAISQLDLRVIISPLGSEVICYCQVPQNELRPEAALLLGQRVLDQAGREYPDLPARCGIGLPASSLEDWRVSLRQAGQALEMARRLTESRPLYFSDLSVYRLLFQLEHSPELIAFQEETIGPLLALENTNEFIHTLEAYFEHNGNLSQTAEALFLHRNTLIYRMERIAAITNLELDKPENRLALQLALRIYRMLGSKS